MKNANVTKINTMGKVAHIILIIMKVIAIIGIVCSIIAGIAALALPGDAIYVEGDCTATINVNSENVPSFFEPETIVELPESDINWHGIDLKVIWNITRTELSKNEYRYDINGSVDGFSGKAISTAAAVAIFACALWLCAVLAALIFGSKLAKALEKCDSPFEQNVINSMKKFGFSLIPFAAISLLLNGIGLLTVLFTLIILMFIFTFNYGAQLQKESDETL